MKIEKKVKQQDEEKGKTEIALLICIKRQRIVDLIKEYPDLREHWDGLYGKRLGLIKRMAKLSESD